MTVISYQDLQSRIKSGNVGGGYLFLGEEEYLKSYWRRQLRNAVLDDPSDMFNRYDITAESYTPQALKDAIEALPSFAEHKIVEVSGVAVGGMKESDLDQLCAVLSLLPEHGETTLILYCTDDELKFVDTSKYVQPSDKKAAAALTKVGEHITAVNFPHETPVKLAQWVSRHFSAAGVTCPPEAAKELIRCVGRDMYRLSSETDRLSALMLSAGRTEITAADITANTVHLFEFGPFDFTNALLDRDSAKAFRILREMRTHPDASKLYPPELVLGTVSRVWADLTVIRSMQDGGVSDGDIMSAMGMNSYRFGIYASAARRAPLAELTSGLDICRRCDTLMKSSQIPGDVILDRMIPELLCRDR